MRPDRHAELRALLDAATGTPWRWSGNVDTGDVRLDGRPRRRLSDRQPDGSEWPAADYASAVLDVDGVERKPDDVATRRYEEYLRDEMSVSGGKGGCRPMTDDEIAEDVKSNWLEDPWGNPREDNRLRFYEPDPGFYRPARDLAVYEVARNRGLPDDTPRTDERIYRADVVDVRNPNARLIRDGINALPGLLAEIAELRRGLGRIARNEPANDADSAYHPGWVNGWPDDHQILAAATLARADAIGDGR